MDRKIFVKEEIKISMNFENVLYEVKDGILYLTLNRPEARNALSPEMWRDITAAVQAARVDDSIRVVIVTHTGDKALASGADIRELHERYYMLQMLGTATEALQALENLNKPTICAINGFALGGGCELALACDIRVATSRSKFGQPEVNLSLIPGAGGTQRLPRLVGPGIAKEMIFTGKIITADEAKEIGLVNHVTEDTHEAVLAEAGLTLDNVVKTTVFVQDLADFGAVNEIYGTYFHGGFPARSCVQIAALPKNALVEIECIAVR